MTIDPKSVRPDVHQRFLEVCAREVERHAEHVAFIRALRLPKPARLWICSECQSAYLVHEGAPPRCRRCA